jgi:hypothetical protein
VPDHRRVCYRHRHSGTCRRQSRRALDGWFAINAQTSQNRINRIAQKIAALSGESSEALTVAPIAARIRSATLRTDFGQDFAVQVTDETGASAKVRADVKLLPGAHVTIDGLRAVVGRDSSDGFLVVFDRHPTTQRLA